MSTRFVRCNHCGLTHEAELRVCPTTGGVIERRGNVNESEAPGDAQRGPASAIPTPGPTPRLDLVGRTLGGKYRVRSVLGQGGMGTVLEAEHVTIGRPVAVKVLHRNQLHEPRAVRRFHQEARAAGTIGHPNICEVYDYGVLEQDGCPYLVMQRLVGETLAQRMTQGPLPLDEAIDVFCQLLSGLAAAHDKGIVHRDVKPENVFITRPVGYPRIVKILDFGISTLPHVVSQGHDDVATAPGTVVGTPRYMAPEQAGGERDLDGRADVYSCGVMLYEALTGRLPYTARSYNALLVQMLTTKPRPAREHRPDLPEAIEPILSRALAPAREERYPSAGAMLADLAALRAPPSAPPPEIPDALPTLRDIPLDHDGDDDSEP